MKKVDKERQILKLATPILKEIYGSFDIDLKQKDSPDAAIYLDGDVIKKVGIEITTVDKQEVQQYLNDKKITKHITSQKSNPFETYDKHGSQPIKKISTCLPKEYIFEGVIKKKNNYSRYMKSNDYDEMIIVAFSSYLQTDHQHFEYYKLWTDFLLSESLFPFNKVIFVCSQAEGAIVYDKDIRRENAPQLDKDKELGVTIIQSPVFPIGERININDLYNKEPLAPYQNKNKAREARKTKRKVKKKARKDNRK